MYSGNKYEETGVIYDETDITGKEIFRVQNNECYSVPPALPKLTERSGKGKTRVKHCFLITALIIVVVFCISSAFISSDVHYSVQLNKLKHLLSELKTSNENVTLTLMKLQGNNFNRLILNNSEIKLSDIELLSEALKGYHPLYPASSCASTPSILNSGYYWIQSWNGSVVKVYCDMTRTCGNITGGWMRVALLDMRDNSAQCPPGLCLNMTSPRTCRKCDYNVTCSSDVFPVYINYTKVCGKIIGYQIGTVDAFSTRFTRGLDGVKLSHRNPSENIWTFAAAFADNYMTEHRDSLCPCINRSDSMIPDPPTEIGSNYFCDTGTRCNQEIITFFKNDSLWDGAGCEGSSTCCSFNNPPWFYRELTASTDDIEMNLCTDEPPDNESLGLQVVEIYVQ